VVIEKKETYTYTSPTGVVFVITDAPSLVYENDEGAKEVRLTPESSRTINKYIREGLELYSEPNILSASFEEVKQGLSVDLQLKFDGDNISLDKSSLDTWNTIIKSVKKSFDFIKKAYEQAREVRQIKSPIVVPAKGSLIIGLRSHPESTPPLFEGIEEFDESAIKSEIQILQLLIDGNDFINEEKVQNDLLLSYPEVRIGVIKAIEALAPQDSGQIHEVKILPKSNLFFKKDVITLTKETHRRASKLRKDLESKSEQEHREVIIVGQIDALERNGSMRIKNIEYNYPVFKNYPTRALFQDHLWKNIVTFFEEKNTRLVFRGVEFKFNGQWSNRPIIKSIQKAPEATEVKDLALAKSKMEDVQETN